MRALGNLVPFVQFKKRKKQHGVAEHCNFTKTNTLPWVLFTFFKLYKCYQIEQCITYMELMISK